MKVQINTSLLFLLILSHFYSAEGVDGCENIPVQSALFNLCPFAQASPFNVSSQDLSGDISLTLGTGHIQSCDGHEDIWARYYTPECIDLAVQAPNYRLINESGPEQGVIMTFPESDEVSNAYQFVVYLFCNKDISDASQTQFTLISNEMNNTITIITIAGSSKYGCPVLFFGQLINFLENNKQLFAIIFGILGLFLIFFGFKLFNIAIFIVTLLLGTLLVGTLTFELTDFATKGWILWTIFGASLAIGLAVGYLALKYSKLAYFIIGAGLGVVGGLILYNGLVLPFVRISSGTVALYLIIIACAIIGGIIALFLTKSIVIVSTSVIGAYLFVRSLAVFIGGFPPETNVSQGIEKFSPIIYAYLAATTLVAAFGIYCQFRSTKKPKALETQRSDYYYAYE